MVTKDYPNRKNHGKLIRMQATVFTICYDSLNLGLQYFSPPYVFDLDFFVGFFFDISRLTASEKKNSQKTQKEQINKTKKQTTKQTNNKT